MQCPKCRGTTRPVRARRGDPATGEAPSPTGDLELDRCGSCHGTWYDRRELDLLLGRDLSGEFGRQSIRPTRRTACARCGAAAAGGNPFCACGASLTAKCPRCEVELQAVRVVGIELDLCPSCGGLWLDESEALALAAMFALRPSQPSAGVCCSRCGRSGLGPAEVLGTEDGFVCDTCHAASRARRSELRREGTPCDPEKIGIAADLLLTLAGSIVEL